MPRDNQEAYKEMYEMGERLMQMAKDGGYNPEDSSEEESSESDGQEPSESSSYSSKDKVSAALSMFK